MAAHDWDRPGVDTPPYYPISVVIPTMSGWPTTSISVLSVIPQVRRAGGQLVIADGSGRPAPSRIAGAADITWLSMPGATVFELRQAGYAAARSEIIASTEDHCRPADDWLSSVIDAHRDNPSAALIFGTVENGTRRHLIDWALYCAGYATWAPPLAATTRANPGHANTSWKRWALERAASGGENVLEFRLAAALRKAGEQVVADPSLRVRHFQCAGVGPTAALFFHNGRAIAGIRRGYMGYERFVRVLAPPLVAGVRTARTLRTAWAKPGVRRFALRSAPLIALLHLSHASGEAIGLVSGAGDSGRHLH